METKPWWHKIVKMIIILFLFALLILIFGFFAVLFDWTRVSGSEDKDSFEYNLIAQKEINVNQPIVVKGSLPSIDSIYGPNESANWCKINVVANINDFNANKIFQAYRDSRSQSLLDKMLLAIKLRLTDRESFDTKLKACDEGGGVMIKIKDLESRLSEIKNTNIYSWQTEKPWRIIKEAITKDKDKIYEAANKAGVQPRLLVSVVIVEQLRLYYTQRELFEKFFAPLKILANANKMAWGVMSIKEKMAIDTEINLRNKKSALYLGSDKESLLDFPPGVNIARERYNRLTDDKNHFYSYLYGALIIKEIETQWANAGHSIDYRPEVVATLFNIGFNHSQPKDNPTVGGSTININGNKYFFGSLAYEFYYSGELMDEFPFE